jgi:Mlc titration factor MtfA (ptsG expression regulator)
MALTLGGVVTLCASVFGSPWLAGLGAPVGVAAYLFGTARYRKRRRLLSTPFPAGWRALLEARVEFYRRLCEAGRFRFEDDVRIFLAEQRVVGSHGANVDDSTRVLIAASAAMLGHGLPDWEWPSLRDIVVYPKAFDEEYRVGDHGELAGMVHSQGPILIAQSALRHGFARPRDGHNVALHELAHVMDFASGAADGVPADLDFVATAPWVEAISSRLSRMRRGRYAGALRPYAGTNEAELFAVAVEAFFERPEALRERDPELFELLADYLNQRPTS